MLPFNNENILGFSNIILVALSVVSIGCKLLSIFLFSFPMMEKKQKI